MEYGVGTRVRSNCTVDAFISSSSVVVVVDRAAQRETRAREKGEKRESERESSFFFWRRRSGNAYFFLNFFSCCSGCLFSLEKLNEMKLSRHHILFRCFTFFKQPQNNKRKKYEIKKATHNTDKTKRTTTTRRFLPNPRSSN